MSLTRKAPTAAAKKPSKPRRQDLALALAEREAELAEARRQQTATANVLKVISRSAFDLQAIFDTLIVSAVELSGSHSGAICVRDGEIFRYWSSSGPGASPELHNYLVEHPANPGRGSIVGRAVLSRQTEQIPDIHEDSEYSVPINTHGNPARALVGVPLLGKDKVEGAIVLTRLEPGTFPERQIEILQTFADQAVIAIENARLFDEVQARTRELEESLQQQTATADVLKVISRSAFDLQTVLDTLAASAAALIGANFAVMNLKRGDVIRPEAAFGSTPELVEFLAKTPQRPGRRTVAGRVFITGEVQNIRDVLDDPEYDFGDAPQLGNFRSLLGVPLFRDHKVEGSFTLGREQPGGFTQRQIEIVQTFADQAVIAIENVRLFDEVQAKTRDLTESLEQQTASAEILRVISSSPTDVQPVFDAIAHSAATLCEATNGAVFRLRDGLIHLVGHYSMSQKQLASLQRSFPAPLDRAIASGRAILDRAVIHIPDIAAEPGYPAALAKTGLRSVLSVPMLRNGESIGSINVSREAVRSFSGRQIELLRTFADQAVIAINNVGLFNETQEALRQQTATSDILKVIASSPNNLQPVLDEIVETACRLCGAYDAVVLLREGEQLRAAAHHGPIPFTFASQEISRGLLAGRAVIERRAIHIDDIAKYADEYPVAAALASQRSVTGSGEMLWRANLVMPLMREGEAVGTIGLRRAEPVAFSESQIELLKTFADQAVIAIENVRLFDEVQAKTRDLEESLQQQTATADVLKVISRSAFDLQAVLRTLVESAARLCGADKATITREINGVYYRAESYGFSDEFMDQIRNVPVAPERGSITGLAMLEGKAIQVEDVEADPEYWPKTFAKPGELRTGLGIPMMRNGAPIGVLALMRTEVRPFNAKQIELVQTFADQAVIAIENARLFDEVRARTRELEESLRQQTATADVLKVISRSAFDLDAVFDALLTSAVSLIGSRGGTICVREGDGFKYRAVAEGRDSAMWRYLSENPPTPGRASVAGRILLSGRPEIITDSLLDNDLKVPVHALAGSRSIAGVPLLRNDRVEGALMVGRAEVGPFDSRQIELLQTFADQAVIAIENVRLFDEVQARTRDLSEALMQQTATADVLKAISRSAFDLDTVLETLIATAVRLCDATYGEIFRRHGDLYRYAASRMDVDPAHLHHERATEIAPGRGTLVGRVALENRAVEIVDAWNDPEYAEKEEARVGNVRAMLGVPLMRDGEMIGAFALGRAEPIPFSQRQVDLVATFADQAVIAIENVRLFDEVQAKTRDLEESLQQQTATANVLKVISRSAFDLQAVLTTLAESARDLCGASFVTLSLREGDAMRLRAESGCTPEIVQFMAAHPIRAGRETFTGRVMLSGEAMHVPDVFADPEYDFGEGPRIGNYRALLAAPLLRDGQVEGVFALARPEPMPFSERQIEMVRAFADQAVIAIENSRLFEEVQARTRELAASLDDLRKAQDRLIQSEKLASLGQLTAGIAHEIKNPLNFINNFSALSRELIGELAEAIKGGAVNEATNSEADELIGAIDGNLAKIVQHGKRADSIVKNMLLHSREGSGERSTTNVNAMVEEALNLAYHGARAEKPGFNVTIVKSLDPNAGFAEVYAQEITRVLLNLISNGFYATSRRRQSTGDGAYEPTIGASTRDLGPMVEIAIRDNGTGIPDDVKAKMFNPFFTTKPAGEGTGLGLSLSHDIVVKQHGGAIEVSTEPDAFTQFTIVLPRGAVQI